jgi:hypothetical protein
MSQRRDLVRRRIHGRSQPQAREREGTAGVIEEAPPSPEPKSAPEPEAEEKPKPKRRPTKYDEAVANGYLDRLASREDYKDLRSDASLPSPRTIYRWRCDHPEFDELHRKALEARAEARMEKIEGYLGELYERKLDPHSATVLMKGEATLASREDPKRFSEKANVGIELSGPGGKPITVQTLDDEASIMTAARLIALKLVKGNASLAKLLSQKGVLPSEEPPPVIDGDKDEGEEQS